MTMPKRSYPAVKVSPNQTHQRIKSQIKVDLRFWHNRVFVLKGFFLGSELH